ncbi:MAG: hypothetical protein JWM11_6429 [Planctomycetaceae bacterium]|nr:hypothetical protein [Planctomycetaceae bacterium]
MKLAVRSQWPGGITRVMLLGEQAASKTAGWGSNPHARADCRHGSTEKGVRLAPIRIFFGGESCWCESSRRLLWSQFVPMV